MRATSLTRSADHPRVADVTGMVVGSEPALAEVAVAKPRAVPRYRGGRRRRCRDPRPNAVLLPVDVLLLVGIFGNVSDVDIETTIRAVPRLCTNGAIVIWTRHRRPRRRDANRAWVVRRRRVHRTRLRVAGSGRILDRTSPSRSRRSGRDAPEGPVPLRLNSAREMVAQLGGALEWNERARFSHVAQFRWAASAECIGRGAARKPPSHKDHPICRRPRTPEPWR